MQPHGNLDATRHQVVYRGLKLASLVLGVLYVLFGVAHVFVLPPEHSRVMAPTALSTALLMFITYALIQRHVLRASQAHAVAAALAALALVNSFLHLYLTNSPVQTTNLILVLIGVSLIFASRIWFAVAIVAADALWLIVAAPNRFEGLWTHYGFALLAASMLAAIVHELRYRYWCELENARQNLLASEQRYRILSEAATEGIVIHDSGHVLDANKAFLEMLGATSNDVLGREIVDFVSPESRAEVLRHVIAGQDGVLEFVARRLDGSTFPAEASVRAINGHDECIKINVIRDVSTQRRLNRYVDLQQRLILYSDRMMALAEMAQGMAHEINNPLAIIVAATEKLRRIDRTGSEDRRRLYDMVERNAMRINTIIRTLATYAGEAPVIGTTPTPLQHIVALALQHYRDQIKAAGIQLNEPSIDGRLLIDCNEPQLVRALENLISNAYDAVIDMPLKRIEIAVLDHHDWIELRVSDSGTEIPDTTRERLMQPFFTTKPQGKGMGLGLSFSKGVVEAHHGKLYLDRSSRKTTFVVELPKRQPTVREASTAAAA